MPIHVFTLYSFRLISLLIVYGNDITGFKEDDDFFFDFFFKSLRLHLQKFQLIYITLDDLYSNFCFNQITTFATSRSMTGTRVIKM